VDVVVEVLSPADSFQRVIRKCKICSDWGIPVLVVMDPEGRVGWVWDTQLKSLKPTGVIVRTNGKSISLSRIFEEQDKELQ
jgi:Uma2 family endonuclease